MFGAQPRGWPTDRDGRSPPGPDLQVEPPTDRRSEGPGARPTVGARRKTRREEPDKAWAPYTGQRNVLSTRVEWGKGRAPL